MYQITDSCGYMWYYVGDWLYMVESHKELKEKYGSLSEEVSQDGYHFSTWREAIQFLLDEGYIE